VPILTHESPGQFIHPATVFVQTTHAHTNALKSRADIFALVFEYRGGGGFTQGFVARGGFAPRGASRGGGATRGRGGGGRGGGRAAPVYAMNQ